ncbi:armadillo-type protein [Roridomyces roridus]|uniref:Armadillo-type protein n=1 Tax=Roridomyces roridus TaxID=1738132 RepID=A0AAD7CF73_9AGAR|nr:armadillo-type protein [Roridomyces roridus]
MEQALEKIRPHTQSTLAHQKTPATLLIALESTFREQSAEATPTAYFAALLTTLDGTIQKRDVGLDEGDILPAELYLLALVAPFVSPPVLRTHLLTILNFTAPLFPSLAQHAPALRSQLSLYHVLLLSLDRSQLETQGIRQSFASILQLCLDPRPKVRRKAADTVRDVLANPPAPLARHPYAERVAEWIKSALSEVSAGPFARSKASKGAEPVAADSAIHILALLRPVLQNLPPSSLPGITNLLLTLPRLGNPYLSQSAYSILSELFALPIEDESVSVNDQISDVLKAVLASPPSKAGATLSPAWVQVLGSAMVSYHSTDPDAASSEFGPVWKTVWTFLESSDSATKAAAAQSLDLLTRCITPSMVDSAILEPEPRSTLGKVIVQITKALDSLTYAGATPQLLSVISSLIARLHHKADGTKTAAEALLLPLITRVGDLRTQKGFEFKEHADATLAAAMRVLGPQSLLAALPLNLEPSDRQEGREPRAYLLPLLAQPHPSPLSHFVSYFVPLSERMFGLQQEAETEGRQSQAKLWSVLIGQIWTGLSGYCWATADLKEALNPSFSALLSGLLYGQAELRPAVLKALKIMVESNVAVASGAQDTAPINPNSLSAAQAAENIAYLRTQAESWLAVLFNVFGSVGRDSRGSVGEVITVWAAIAGEQEIAKAQVKVVELLKANLASQASQPPRSSSIEGGSAAAATQDLVLLLLPNLSRADAQQLFQLCLSAQMLSAKDNGVQKRGYKILTRLIESQKVEIDAVAVLKQLDELADGLTAAAKKDRFNLLSLLIPLLPSSAMHVIPSLIPEAVLGTKEPSEKARTAAFDVVVAMGKKMNEGGVVKRNLMDGMDEDGAEDAAANIQEFMTMVAGGLAGASPHMISATVTAISRLVFEFKDVIPMSMHGEILATLLVFISSANREIVKSILGFVKLSIHTLPADLMRPHLPTLVPALLGWSHDHKNHFKAKVRHIFERMLRRFGWDEVYGCAGEEEAKKVLVNIKKRKERAKRKKANGKDEEDEPAVKPTTGDAFEDVLYGSESELEDSDDEAEPQKGRATAPPKKKGATQGARIRIDDDEPMDLLQGAASRITQGTSNRRRKPGQDASRFKVDDDTGKMVIDEEGDADDELNAADDVAGAAYRESLTSVDGFTRGPNGRVKFNKDTKKRRREEADADGDVEMGEGNGGGDAKKAKRRAEPKFGHEFKAKKAGGDVKKGGVDPYAYMSLSQAAKKSHRKKEKIGIVGKR